MTLASLSRRPWPLLLLVVLAFFLAMRAIAAFWQERPPALAPALPLMAAYEQSPTALFFRYPQGWQYNIPRVNILLLGPQALFEMEPTAHIVVHRNLGLISEESLHAMLDTYLRRGPLHGKHGWRQLGEREEIQFSGRPALKIAFQGRDIAAIESEELHSEIIVTQAENKMAYIFVATVPLAERAQFAATLDAILASVQIRE